jgi:uncharacterized caspase-like protein
MKFSIYIHCLIFMMLALTFGSVAATDMVCEPPFCTPDPDKIYGERFALVIGNGGYGSGSALANPPNDAQDISVKLEEMGFNVETLVDASHANMQAAVERFGSKLSNKAIGLFFFAGHGMQQSDQNFLIPVDTVDTILNTSQVEGNALSLNKVVSTMNHAGVSIIILDACRNNPMGETMASSSGRALANHTTAKVSTSDERTLIRAGGKTNTNISSASVTTMQETKAPSSSRLPPIGSGLAQPPKATNRSYFAYATSPGDVAQDGQGRNSPFTTGLLLAIRKEHRLEDVFAETMESVFKSTGKQKPWTTQSLGDVKFYF